ncbi:MAG: hypothetical protein P8080_07055 [Gammaproteobacteria bacterium]
MGIGTMARGGIAGVVLRWASRLRFPYLFAITGVLFVVNLFVPDVVPFADEIIMGLVALLLGSLKKKKPRAAETQPQSKQP